MDSQTAVALIALLGKVEQVGEASGAGCDMSRYNFVVADEVVPFFVLLLYSLYMILQRNTCLRLT